MSGTEVVGSDWDGIGETLKQFGKNPIPVFKKGIGYRKNGNDLNGNYNNNLKFFNGYEIDLDIAVRRVLKALNSNNQNFTFKKEDIYSQFNRTLFSNTIDKICSGAKSFLKYQVIFLMT